MEINIPTDVVLNELMKKYYTKEEVDKLLEDFKSQILSTIQNSARVVFEESEEKKSSGRKKKQNKQPGLTLEEPKVQFTPIMDSGSVNENTTIEPYTPVQTTVTKATQTPPPQQTKYEFLNVDAMFTGSI